MSKVFIVVDVTLGRSYAVLRVFNKNKDAIAYGESLVFGGAIEEYDVYEREVY